MKTALELLEELKSNNKIDEETYKVQKDIIEQEEFKEDFKEVFDTVLRYDNSELRYAVSTSTNEKKDKCHFVRTLYARTELMNFLNYYWNRMDEIISLAIESLNANDNKENE